MVDFTLNSVLSALKAAGEETRLRILALFRSGELTVSELVNVLRQSQPRVSRHLKLLCEAGLLERHREGTWIFYRLAQRGLEGRLARSILDYIPFSDQILQHDQERLADIRHERNEKAREYFRANADDWDRIRALYIPESEVEDVLLDVTQDMDIEELLDVGTGTGRMLEVFAERTKHGVGIDLSREMLAIARSHLEKAGIQHCQVRQGDMYDLALSDSTMDLVLFHQVLHFADDPLSALKETSRILRDSGRVIIVDFAPHDNESLRDEYAHRRLGFSDREVINWCNIVGLKCDPMRLMPGRKLDICIWVAHKK